MQQTTVGSEEQKQLALEALVQYRELDVVYKDSWQKRKDAIAKALAMGATQAQVARSLGISPQRVSQMLR